MKILEIETQAYAPPTGRFAVFRQLFLYPALVAAYLLAMAYGHGLRIEHVVLGGGLLLLCALGSRSRLFLDLFLPLFLLGAFYDLQWLIEPHLHAQVHVAAPYLRERLLFGIHRGTHVLTANQFFARHHWPAVDLATGFAYLMFPYEPLLLFGALFLGRRHALVRRFGWTFLAVNVVGLSTAFLYPAAPPWYVVTHGLSAPVDRTAPAFAAGALRFDQLLHIHYFRDLYARSADVFGALPSLHVAGPLLVFLFARHLRRRWLDALTFAFYLLICFAAVYLQHHYVQDVLAGSAYAFLGYRAERLISTLLRRRRARSESALVAPLQSSIDAAAV